MKILVIIGECIQVNSSANLCHLAYLRGLVEAGHDVTLITADSRGEEIDPAMTIPSGVKIHSYYSVTLYEKLGKRKQGRPSLPSVPGQAPRSKKKKGWKARVKNCILSMYGPHGIYGKFASAAFRFRSAEPFDLVLSLSTPPASHLLAYRLLSSGHVKSGRWIQLWEDPWSGDVFCQKKKASAFREEKRLLKLADRVCYVSPLTLRYQKEKFPEAAHKMFWVPLAAYYEAPSSDETMAGGQLFGYFGDYRKPARDLSPFYRAAKTCGVEVNICGASNVRLDTTEKIRVCPRLPLQELRPIEEKTDVLVFLCNCFGGQIPGKIYQYSSTNKTILFILDGTEEERRALKSFFEPYHRFVFCENNEESIEAAIRRICRGELGEINNSPLFQFHPKAIVQRILEEGMRETNG